MLVTPGVADVGGGSVGQHGVEVGQDLQAVDEQEHPVDGLGPNGPPMPPDVVGPDGAAGEVDGQGPLTGMTG